MPRLHDPSTLLPVEGVHLCMCLPVCLCVYMHLGEHVCMWSVSVYLCVCVCLMASARFPAVGYFDDHPVGGAYWDSKRLAEGRALFAWPSLRSSPFEGIITELTFPDTKWRFYDNSPVMSAITLHFTPSPCGPGCTFSAPPALPSTFPVLHTCPVTWVREALTTPPCLLYVKS